MRHVEFTPEETGVLYAVSAGLLEAQDFKVFAGLAELMGEELHLAGCSIWYLGEGAPGPERVGFYQRQGEVILDYLPNLDYQVAHRVTESGELLVENNIGEVPGFTAGLLCPGLIALPLLIDNKPGGALCFWIEQSSGAESVSLYMAREMARLLANGLYRWGKNLPVPEINTGNDKPGHEYNLQTAVYRSEQVVPGVSLGLRSMEVNARGGDFYEIIVTREKGLAVILGTIMGRSMSFLPWKHGARLVMKMLAGKNVAPARSCTEMNSLLYEELHSAGMLMGLLYAAYNPLTGNLSYCNAGYNLPVILREKPAKDAPGGLSQPLLGLAEAAVYAEKSVRLKTGDIAVFYSNGLAEMINNEGAAYPRERIAQTLQKYHYYNAPSLLDCLMLDIHQFLGGRRILEHVTLAVMKVE